MRSLTPFRFGAVLGLAAAAASPPTPAQEKEPPQVDQDKVDAAVAKGSEWLRARVKEGLPPINEKDDPNHAGSTYNEMVIYTLVHAGVDRGDPLLAKLVFDARQKPPAHTYTGALRAMAFELYDPVKLRTDIMECAMFLIDNQGKDGRWGYSKPVPLPPLPQVIFTLSKAPPRYVTTGTAADHAGNGGPAAGPSADASASAKGAADGSVKAGAAASGSRSDSGGVSTGGGSSGTQLKKAPPKVNVARRDWGGSHDLSNTQYALLGLRAAMGAGIMPPPDCLPLAEKYYTDAQNDDGGWGYLKKGEKSYGSMTVGGVSSLSICIRAKPNGGEPMKDPRIQKGIDWLAKNLNFNNNPGLPRDWHFYWIYGVERAGAFAETEWFGDRPWYHDGATWLLNNQKPDGTWGKGETKGDQILDTCWAILFLRRATRHIARQRVIVTGK